MKVRVNWVDKRPRAAGPTLKKWIRSIPEDDTFDTSVKQDEKQDGHNVEEAEEIDRERGDGSDPKEQVVGAGI